MQTPQALARSDTDPEQPRLLLFYSQRSGRCRRVEGFIAQALQRRHNHDTFKLVRIDVEKRPDLAERFKVDQLPTLFVVEGRVAKRRIVAPKGVRELEAQLSPWLRLPARRATLRDAQRGLPASSAGAETR
jgi:thioredoxin-like negative regulator of GroEL